MVPTGRQAGEAVAAVPAEQADQYEAARKEIQPTAEAYIVENVLPAWEEVKRHLTTGPFGRPWEVKPRVRELMGEIDQEMLQLPGTVVREVVTGSPLPMMVSLSTKQKLKELVEAVGWSRSGYVGESAVNEFSRQLEGKRIVDGVSNRMLGL